MPRDIIIQRLPFPAHDPIDRLPEIESVMICIQQNLPCILVGPSGSGKTMLIEHIAATSGKALVVFPLNADIDTMDLVGGFEQVDPQRSASAFLEELDSFMNSKVLASLPLEVPEEAILLLEILKSKDLSSVSFFSDLSSHLRALEIQTSLPQFRNLAFTCQHFAETPMTLENARFEWVDGVLIKALEQGKWLVLDNANLCSASVLDRLNSLLEPNGFLSINEHCGPDGEPKIVKPHPDFRIFLTMDARFGELSRAMRNRAIEIFLEPLPAAQNELAVGSVKPEASMRRFQNLQSALELQTTDSEKSWMLQHVALNNLSWTDLPLLNRFTDTHHLGQSPPINFSAICFAYNEIYQAPPNQSFRAAIGDMLGTLAKKTSLAPAGFRDAQVSGRAVPLLFRHSCTDRLIN
jgi:midasin (ATPase involved in ribosome maturation)